MLALEANGYEQLEEAMDVIKRGVTSTRKVNRHWNISILSLFDHLNGKTRCEKIGPIRCVNIGRRCCCLDFKHAKTWITYMIITTRVQGGRTHSRPMHTIMR